MPYYGDEDDINIQVRHRDPSPRNVRYVQSPPRPRYYPANPGPSYLVPEHQTTVVARSRSRSRTRHHDHHEAPPQQPPAPPPQAQPIIIHNSLYNERSSDDDSESEYESRRRKGKGRATRGRRRSSSSWSSSSSRSRSRNRMTRKDWEAEQTRQELEQLRIAQARDEDQRRLAQKYRDQGDLEKAKKELDEIKAREAKAKEQERIKRQIELERLKEEEEAAEQKKRRDKEAKEAVERYKQEEAKRMAKEAKEKEENEKEYKRRMQEDLINSGLDEKAIAAIMKKEKIPEPPKPLPAPMPQPHQHPHPHPHPHQHPDQQIARATYTRMARRHLSIETLRTHHIEWDYDVDPEYLLIKRWVPEWEQDQLWKHTRTLRSKRGKALMIEEKKQYLEDPNFEWVRKKSSSRKRSKSPSLLMYLAGAHTRS